MKFWATVVYEFQARTVAEAGERLNTVLDEARERANMEPRSVELRTPPTDVPVSLPAPGMSAGARPPLGDGVGV
jgi:hypothetical protein